MNSFIWKNPANAGGGGGNITQLEQKIHQLEQQIQNLTQQLINVAKKNERNKFTNLQEIQYPGEALSFIQDNNSNYIHFKKSDGTRRGYLGVGSSNSKVMDVVGAEGVKIQATTGDINLIAQNNINANNKPILNVGVSNDANAALTMKHLLFRITSLTEEFVNPTPGTTINWKPPVQIGNILSFEQYKEIAPNNWEIANAVKDYWYEQNGTLSIRWNQKQAPLGKIIVKLNFIRKT